MFKIADHFDAVLKLEPEASLIEYRGDWLTRGAFSKAVCEIRSLLRESGIADGARIGVLARNHPASMAAIVHAIRTSGTIVPINPLQPIERLAADLKQVRVPIVIGSDEDLNDCSVKNALNSLDTPAISLGEYLSNPHIVSAACRTANDNAIFENENVILEMLTSGTTGAPKRIPLKRDAFSKSFRVSMAYGKEGRDGVMPRVRNGVQLVSLPISHIGGLWGALSSFAAGRRLCLLEKFEVEAWRDAVVRHQLKVAGAVPAALRMILDANIPKHDLSSLVAVRSGTQPLDPELISEFFERYGVPVLQNYGATEFSGAVAGWSLSDFYEHYPGKKASVGKFQSGVTGRIVDPDTGMELECRQEGLLEMKSPQFGNHGKWLRTTDRASIDEDGFLYIHGRADNAILRGGFKVHPEEVAAVLEQHESVREAVIVGLSDRRLGAAPAAAIVLKAKSKQPNEQELKAYCREKLLAYQVPVKFLFVDELPRTTSMKPALPAVRALFGADQPEAV